MACSVDRSALGRRPARGLRLGRSAEPALAARDVDDRRGVVTLSGLMEDPPSRTLEKRLVSAGAAECAGEPECSRTSSVCTSPICSGADGRFSRRGSEGGSLQAFLDGRAACREAFLSVLEGESVRRPLSSGGSSAAATRRRRRSRSSAPAEGVPDVRMAASSCLAHA